MIIKNLIKYFVTCFVFLLSISSALHLTEEQLTNGIVSINELSKVLDQSGYERSRQNLKQANGLPIYLFEKKVPCGSALCREYTVEFIKIYECSSNPRDHCLRRIQYGERQYGGVDLDELERINKNRALEWK